MSDSLFSTYWYRVANLKPALRDSAKISRHIYRGQPWYVLRNSLTGRSNRFNMAAYALIGQMDGQRTIEELWENSDSRPDAAAPTQDEIILLLGRLHDADLIQNDILPSTVEILRQAQGEPSTSWQQRISNPFSLRFPLCDPDRFLKRWAFLTAPLFNCMTLLIWLLVVFGALIASTTHWPELSSRLANQLVIPSNLLLMWLIYPVVKTLHELGHAFAVKIWGGEVHELGIMLLALIPIPYVDATTAASFSKKRHRIAVAAMGMMVELFIAALALFVWLNVEPGLISNIAFNVILIAGLSTLLFNGNPLLRYDGYYMLADMVEIPNLSQRSKRYFGYLVQRYLLKIKTALSPVTAHGEKGWFILYAPLSSCYRIMVLLGLVWLVSDHFFFIGILIALWGVASLMILPVVRALYSFLSSPAARKQRTRLLVNSTATILGLILLVGVFPMPLWTTTQGVVWLPEQSTVRAGTACEVIEVLAENGQSVGKNMPLLQGANPFLKAQMEIYTAQLQELYANYNAHPLHDRVERKMLQVEISRLQDDLNQTRQMRDKMEVFSPSQGNFILIDHQNLTGRFVEQGELLGYIIGEHRPTVRAVINQTDIGMIREQVTAIEVRLAAQPRLTLKAEIERITPAASLKLPSPVLGTLGGGIIAIDPSDNEGLSALESVFQVELSLPENAETPHIGGRVYVRFEHGSMPLAMQWYRSLCQLFLRKFYV